MKNTFNFNLGEINITIEGTPVQITNFQMEFTNEASVQELATSASFIKDLIGEIKSTIKEAQTSAIKPEQSQVVAPAEPIAQSEHSINKTETFWDLPAVWSVMMAKMPEGFKKSGVGCYTYETNSPEKVNAERISIRIRFTEESIDMDVYMGDNTGVHGYLYEKGKRSRISGINPALFKDFIEDLPEEVKDFVKDYFDKINKK